MGNWNVSLPWLLLLSGLMFLGSIAVAWILIVRMPADYFIREDSAARSFQPRHRVIGGILRIATNGFGILLLIAGLIMLVTPGQGILFMFLGITLVDFPGKHHLVRRMLCRQQVLHAVNRIRDRAGRAPIKVPTEGA